MLPRPVSLWFSSDGERSGDRNDWFSLGAVSMAGNTIFPGGGKELHVAMQMPMQIIDEARVEVQQVRVDATATLADTQGAAIEVSGSALPLQLWVHPVPGDTLQLGRASIPASIYPNQELQMELSIRNAGLFPSPYKLHLAFPGAEEHYLGERWVSPSQAAAGSSETVHHLVFSAVDAPASQQPFQVALYDTSDSFLRLLYDGGFEVLEPAPGLLAAVPLQMDSGLSAGGVATAQLTVLNLGGAAITIELAQALLRITQPDGGLVGSSAFSLSQPNAMPLDTGPGDLAIGRSYTLHWRLTLGDATPGTYSARAYVPWMAGEGPGQVLESQPVLFDVWPSVPPVSVEVVTVESPVARGDQVFLMSVLISTSDARIPGSYRVDSLELAGDTEAAGFGVAQILSHRLPLFLMGSAPTLVTLLVSLPAGITAGSYELNVQVMAIRQGVDDVVDASDPDGAAEAATLEVLP